jgi:peptidoglycan/LPS O-acetylase OafA/YrhL
MSTATAYPAPIPAIRRPDPVRRPQPPAPRDTALDLVRACCVVMVVLLHALLVGVTVTSAGPSFVNASDGQPWTAPVTWIAQIMPLFFVVGGFAGAQSFRARRAAGGTTTAFVVGRVRRLLVPAVVTIGVVGVGLLALTVAGVPADLVQIAGFRYSQPLWFLAVFLGCQALLPALLAVHERAPLRLLGGVVAAVVLVDVLRHATGVTGLGFLNLAFVWLALQQVGFLLADGRIDALRRPVRIAIGAGAIALLAAGFLTGAFSPDLLQDLNPPTTALLLVGAAQTMAVSLLRGPLTRLSLRPRVAAFVGFVTPRTMTIYLWHMPVLLVMAGGSALLAMSTGLVLPEPSSAAWWVTRPLWFATVLVLVAIAARLLSGPERRALPPATRSAGRAALAAVLGVVAVGLLLVVGTTVLTAAIAVGLILGALRLVRAPRTASARRA